MVASVSGRSSEPKPSTNCRCCVAPFVPNSETVTAGRRSRACTIATCSMLPASVRAPPNETTWSLMKPGVRSIFVRLTSNTTAIDSRSTPNVLPETSIASRPLETASSMTAPLPSAVVARSTAAPKTLGFASIVSTTSLTDTSRSHAGRRSRSSRCRLRPTNARPAKDSTAARRSCKKMRRCSETSSAHLHSSGLPNEHGTWLWNRAFCSACCEKPLFETRKSLSVGSDACFACISSTQPTSARRRVDMHSKLKTSPYGPTAVSTTISTSRGSPVVLSVSSFDSVTVPPS